MPTNSAPVIRPGPSILDCLAIQRRVLHALMMRELITRFGRENLGVLWLVCEPMIFTLGVVTLWTATGFSHNSAIPIVAFGVTGYSSVLMWRNAASHCSRAVENNKALLYHRGVNVIDVFLTRIGLEIMGATSSFLTLSTIFIYFGLMPMPVDFLLVIMGWIMLAWFGASLALLIGAGTAFSPIVERIWHPASYLFFPISGAAFMVDWLPQGFQRVVLFLPTVHGVEILRHGFFGNAVRSHYDVGYMAECCLGLTLAGLFVVREASRRVEF
ncbi:MAG TPA: ABC transporter permease [Steroidobacteraceae bacterium]|nr:ABC transporter permease [Steroidobacteraceae bacterium]